jgi:hypothetical protein
MSRVLKNRNVVFHKALSTTHLNCFWIWLPLGTRFVIAIQSAGADSSPVLIEQSTIEGESHGGEDAVF